MRVVDLKELAKTYRFKSANKFKNTQEYLEYVIDRINSHRNGLKFHQFLYLLDVLFVILDDSRVHEKASVATPMPFNPKEEISAHYKRGVELSKDEQDVLEYEAATRRNEERIEEPVVEEKRPEKTKGGLFNKKIDWK